MKRSVPMVGFFFAMSMVFSGVAQATSIIETTFDGGGGNRGNMFDVTNLLENMPVDLTGNFEGHFRAFSEGNSTTVQVWYREGSMVGHETSQDGWNLLGSADINPMVIGTETSSTEFRVPFTIPDTLRIAPGETFGLFVYSTDLNLRYTAHSDPAPTFSDGVLQLTMGFGKGFSLEDPPVDSTRTPRTWNGSIEYSVIPTPAAGGAGLAMFGCLAAMIRGRTSKRRRALEEQMRTG